MKSEQIIDAIGQIDDDLLIEVETLRANSGKKRRKRRMTYVSGIVAAACIALVVGVSVSNTGLNETFLMPGDDSNGRDGAPAAGTEAPMMIMSEAAEDGADLEESMMEGAMLEDSANDSASPNTPMVGSDGSTADGSRDRDQWYSVTTIEGYDLEVSFSEEMLVVEENELTIGSLADLLAEHDDVVWTVRSNRQESELERFLEEMESLCKEKNREDIMERYVEM